MDGIGRSNSIYICKVLDIAKLSSMGQPRNPKLLISQVVYNVQLAERTFFFGLEERRREITFFWRRSS